MYENVILIYHDISFPLIYNTFSSIGLNVDTFMKLSLLLVDIFDLSVMILNTIHVIFST